MRFGNKRAIVFAALLLLSFATVTPLALADRTPPTPVVPSQCTALPGSLVWSSTPIINVVMTIKNDEDSGFVAYWALDNYQKTIIIWESTSTTPPTFCALVQYAGTWSTFKGALSPQLGTTQTSDGSGHLVGGIVAWFTSADFLASASTKPLKGDIGTFNFGGTKADILKAPGSQSPNPTYVNYLSFYFGDYATLTYNEPAWAFTYTYQFWAHTYTQQDGIGYGNLWVNANGGSFGDILTQSD